MSSKKHTDDKTSHRHHSSRHKESSSSRRDKEKSHKSHKSSRHKTLDEELDTKSVKIKESSSSRQLAKEASASKHRSSGHKETERERQKRKERERQKERDREKVKSRDRDRDKQKDRDRDRDRDRRDKERDRHREKERERDRDRERRKAKEKERELLRAKEELRRKEKLKEQLRVEEKRKRAKEIERERRKQLEKEEKRNKARKEKERREKEKISREKAEKREAYERKKREKEAKEKKKQRERQKLYDKQRQLDKLKSHIEKPNNSESLDYVNHDEPFSVASSDYDISEKLLKSSKHVSSSQHHHARSSDDDDTPHIPKASQSKSGKLTSNTRHYSVDSSSDSSSDSDQSISSHSKTSTISYLSQSSSSSNSSGGMLKSEKNSRASLISSNNSSCSIKPIKDLDEGRHHGTNRSIRDIQSPTGAPSIDMNQNSPDSPSNLPFQERARIAESCYTAGDSIFAGDENELLDVSDYRYGFTPNEAFIIAHKFYRENQGKTFTPHYTEKTLLQGILRQIKLGPYDKLPLYKKPPEPGWFDVTGKAIQKSWQEQGNTSRKEAKLIFFDELQHLSAKTFKPFVTAHKEKRDQEIEERRQEEERRRRQEQVQILEKKKLEEKRQLALEAKIELEEEEREEEERQRKMDETKKAIMDLLNPTTLAQFQSFAQQQHPTDFEKQEEIIKRCQEDHYDVYINQLQSQGLDPFNYDHLTDIKNQLENSANSNINGLNNHDTLNRRPKKTFEPFSNTQQVDEPSIYTKPNVRAFKYDIASNDRDCMITIARGETITIKVPVHEDGNIIFWEFATDGYDIGFGLYFKWEIDPDDELGGYLGDSLDGASSTHGGGSSHGRPPRIGHEPITEIVPTFRRDSNTEVQCGSHAYPGNGVYLLKFDNSFSMWRSKTLYYKVYYTR